MRHAHPFSEKLFEQFSNASNRQERIQILHDARVFAQNEFPGQLEKLEKLLLQYNPFMVLATFAFIDLTYLPEAGRPMSDSEVIDQYQIELVQALILRHKENEFKIRPFDPKEFQELRDLVSYTTYLHTTKDLPALTDEANREKSAQLYFQSILRAHTKAVRNWGYEKQTFDALKQLYEPLENSIESELGIRVSSLIDAARTQLKRIGEKLQDYFTKTKVIMQPRTIEGAVDAYLKTFNDNEITAEDVNDLVKNHGWTLENVRIMLFHRSTSFLLEVFAFEITDFYQGYPSSNINARKALLSWTMDLGDLSDSNKEHIFLANPIWLRPIIRAAEGILFWPIPTLFHSFCFEMVETFVCSRPSLKDKFLKRRGVFLEKYTAQLFQKQFPDALIFAGSEWDNNKTNEKGENDLLIIFDSIGLIIEAKSGSINAGAKRGGTSLKQEIEQLITEAAEQAHAFTRLLQTEPRQFNFKTKTGATNRVDTSKIKQFLCLSITMEHFGILATQLPELQAIGLARKDVCPIPTISLPDLEIALKLFLTTYELLHYLTRRAAFELNRKFIGDELDLLVFYLQTGFSVKKMPNRQQALVIRGLATQLDKYFINWPGDARFERPKRLLSKWWQDIFLALDKKCVHRRYEIGCVLLDMPDDEQKAFEEQFQIICKKAAETKNENNGKIEFILNHVKSEVLDAVVVAAAVTSIIYPNRNRAVEKLVDHAKSETGAAQCLVILVDVELGHWPYSGMYLLDKL
ncbi:MAG TPA: hypothetical protein VG347_16490 [Verrucomicrobiae bacterium]|nr:hypothetical protein [Verrucomicrobiae bacterium]